MGVEGLVDIGGFDKNGRGGTQSGINVLQGDDTGGTPLWLGELGAFGGDGENGGGDTQWVSEAYHGEAGVKEGRRDMGDAQDGSSAGRGGKPVDNNLHSKKTGYGGTVGGAAANF